MLGRLVMRGVTPAPSQSQRLVSVVTCGTASLVVASLALVAFMVLVATSNAAGQGVGGSQNSTGPLPAAIQTVFILYTSRKGSSDKLKCRDFWLKPCLGCSMA